MILVFALISLLAADEGTFLKAVSANDAATVRTMLDADPALVNAHTPKGTSAVIASMFILRNKETFIPPQENEVLKAVLARKPKLDLFETAALGTPEQLEAMLKTSAVTARSFGWTPLHLAAFAGNVANAELLIAKGADVNARAETKFRNTPLQAALLSGQYATAKLLLDHGADALVRQARGFTPMHEAAELGRQDLIQLLLDHGAELNSRSDSGETPLSEAIRGKHDALAAWMKEKGAKVEEDKKAE
ncbi:MAG TPA: ankyrin repeat domain-containing protein [Thermoanaerobaculia bacterium]|nr:ankyrin repeat domain-containing protein [Thermoanaerobaculia bacterium]